MRYRFEYCNILEVGSRTDDQGRPHQEDALYMPDISSGRKQGVFVLCDGMGGHEFGEVASTTVCNAMGRYLSNRMKEPDNAVDSNMINDAVNAAYCALDDVDVGVSNTKRMGTTMTCLTLHKKGATIAHIGDSRVYHIRQGRGLLRTRILFVTKDHSLVNHLLSIGEITNKQAINHPRRNVLTRALQPHQETRYHADVKTISG